MASEGVRHTLFAFQDELVGYVVQINKSLIFPFCAFEQAVEGCNSEHWSILVPRGELSSALSEELSPHHDGVQYFQIMSSPWSQSFHRGDFCSFGGFTCRTLGVRLTKVGPSG